MTERRRREEELRRRNEELDRFASVVSHDLRNPLNVADGYLDLARETGETEHLGRVADAHDRMNEIVDDLLTLARSGDPDLERVGLAAAARTAWRHVDTGSATLTVDVPGDVGVVADPARLARLFENLFRNAVEHGGDGVHVRVEVGEGQFSVADDGSGLPDDLRERAFEPGESNADGTGLGLAIVRSVAESHGWTVSVDEDAAGARFVVRGVERVDGDGGGGDEEGDPLDGRGRSDDGTAIRND